MKKLVLIVVALLCLTTTYAQTGTPIHGKWETGVLAGAIVTGTISYCIVMGADKSRPAHYYKVADADDDARKHNKALKAKLGLPESYDVK